MDSLLTRLWHSPSSFKFRGKPPLHIKQLEVVRMQFVDSKIGNNNRLLVVKFYNLNSQKLGELRYRTSLKFAGFAHPHPYDLIPK